MTLKVWSKVNKRINQILKIIKDKANNEDKYMLLNKLLSVHQENICNFINSFDVQIKNNHDLNCFFEVVFECFSLSGFSNTISILEYERIKNNLS